MSKITLLKNDAIVKIEIGAGFAQRLQKIFLYLANGLSAEQIALYKQLADKNESFTEEWMEHITTLTVLLKEIETKAIEQGLTFEQDAPEEPTEDN